MTEYQYQPVDEATFEVRFLILLPGKREDPIQGLLFNRPLTKENFPSYEALSYAWGSQEDSMSIAIRTSDLQEAMLLLNRAATVPSSRGHFRSKTKNIISSVKSHMNQSKPSLSRFSKISVTQNLGRALPYLRLRDKPRLFWIDAICVNQKNLPERSQQVRRMADVYRLAFRVVVWLGEESNNTELAIETLKWISSNATFDFESNTLSAVSRNQSDAHWADLNIPIVIGKDVFLSLFDLFKRSWFHRLWVWQEIHLADQTSSLLICGEEDISWQEFRIAVIALYFKSCRITDSIGEKILHEFDELKVNLYRICLEVSEYGFEVLIDYTRPCQCSDPKDRIYALLSLVGSDKIDVEPDYTKTMECVFQETASSYMHQTDSLDLLSTCELNPNRSSKLPTWVPDLSVPKLTESINLQILSSTLSKSPGFENGSKVLLVKGVRISTVQRLWESKINQTSSEVEIATNLNNILSKIDFHGQYSNGEQMKEAFYRAICANTFLETYEPIHLGLPSINAKQEFWEYLSDCATGNTDSAPLSPSLSIIFYYVFPNLTGRSIFITSEGHLGICPIFAQLGDIVVLLVGCQIPLILRPQDDGTHLVVGEAYCHEMMFGETFLGPLPSHFDCIQSRSTQWPLFKNRETGEVTCEDPRLGSLSTGWSRVEHEREKEFTIFLDEKTGKDYHSYRFDPRTFPEEIEKRGVKLEDFKLA